MQSLKVIAFTHKSTPLLELGRFFLNEENHNERLQSLKAMTGIDDLVYLSTCNRIEFIFTYSFLADPNFLLKFFSSFRNDWDNEEIDFAIKHALVYEGEGALRHLMNVASSLDSMVVGEREIITQVRNSFERCKEAGLSGDYTRLVIKNVITTAKKVFTETRIAENPVSVVSLAFRKLRRFNVPSDARFIVIGAGETNANLLKYLSKHGYKNFSIFNRTLSKANALAEKFVADNSQVDAYPIDQLNNFKEEFDVLISCTASPQPIVTKNLYQNLMHQGSKKILIDLALPADIDDEVIKQFSVHYIGLNELKEEAERNLHEREAEIEAAEKIIAEGMAEFKSQLRIRKLELKMQQVPEKIRQIKDKALKDVFVKEVDSLDENSRELLYRMLDYLEKKYISVPMVMAKEIILESSPSGSH